MIRASLVVLLLWVCHCATQPKAVPPPPQPPGGILGKLTRVHPGIRQGVALIQFVSELFVEILDHAYGVSDHPQKLRLRRLCAPHGDEDGLMLDFALHDRPEVNAYAFPTGSIRVTLPLAEQLDDASLLFVIGHEIGHIKLNHSYEKIGLCLGLEKLKQYARASLSSRGMQNDELLEDAEHYVKAQFSQHDEQEADAYALEFMARHGYDLQGAVRVFDQLPDSPGADYRFRSHPSHDKRQERLLEKIRAMESTRS